MTIKTFLSLKLKKNSNQSNGIGKILRYKKLNEAFQSTPKSGASEFKRFAHFYT